MTERNIPGPDSRKEVMVQIPSFFDRRSFCECCWLDWSSAKGKALMNVQCDIPSVIRSSCR